MKWIALSIVLFVVGYTYVNLRYRKRAPEFLPYEDALARAGLARAGYQRVILSADRPADPRRTQGSAPIHAAPGGLPDDLRAALPEPVAPPSDIGHVSADATAYRFLSYPIQFTCALGDDKRQIAGARLYWRDRDIFIVPNSERLPGGLESRTSLDTILLTLPPRTLLSGAYNVTLVGQRVSKSWELIVK